MKGHAARRAAVILGLVLVAGAVGWGVQEKEAILADGRTMLLPLAPRDPRSLMQGDYMALAYADPMPAAERDALPRRGTVVVRLDADGVASVVRTSGDGPLAAGEYRLAYRKGADGGLRFAAESFFFQEGHADDYAAARFAVLKVAEDGEALLVGLAGEDRKPITPE